MVLRGLRGVFNHCAKRRAVRLTDSRSQNFQSVIINLIKSNLDCDYTFSIDLVPMGIPFGAKFIGKNAISIQIQFNLTRFEIEFSMHIL